MVVRNCLVLFLLKKSIIFNKNIKLYPTCIDINK